MTKSFDSIDLNGKLLIAMPDMGDARFNRAVVFICSHSDEGAMGLIINKPSTDVKFDDLLDQLEIEKTVALIDVSVRLGGPVEHARGFVLHTSDYSDNESTLRIDRQFGMTATKTILHDIARGQGPDRCMLAMGYSGWAPRQLESEIAGNGWLVCDGVPDLVFGPDDPGKWVAALGSMGIDPLLLSAEGGQA